MNPMIRNIARTGLAACSMLGVTAIARRKQSGACILMYHGLSNGQGQGMENHSRLHLDIAKFRESAALLARHYHVVALEDLAAMIEHGEPIPNNTVVLTFDDGYASNYHLGLPVLEEFGLHATVFATTAFIEKEIYQWPDRIEYAVDRSEERTLQLDFEQLPSRLDIGNRAAKSQALIQLDAAIKCVPQERHLESIAHIEERAGMSLLDESDPADIYRALTWEQLREMHASDHASIGAHTHTHPILGKTTPEFVRKDMERCLDLLKSKGGVINPTFAYPNGKAGDYSATTEEVLGELGIKVAVTTEMEFNDSNVNLMRLNRMGTPTSSYQTDTICSGFIPFVKQLLTGVMPVPTSTPDQAYVKSK